MPVKLSRLARARAAILELLERTGRPLTAGELSSYAVAGRATAEERRAILEGLERDGLVERTAVPDPYRPPPRIAYRLAEGAAAASHGGPPR